MANTLQTEPPPQSCTLIYVSFMLRAQHSLCNGESLMQYMLPFSLLYNLSPSTWTYYLSLSSNTFSFFLPATVFKLHWLPSSGSILEMEGVDRRWKERENHRVIVSRSGLQSSDASRVLGASGAPAKLCTSVPLTLARCGNHFPQLLNSGFPHFSITFSSS